MKHSHIVLIVLVLLTACKNTITEQRYSQFILIQQTQGPDLGYNPLSGVSILYQDDYAFKDLNQNGKLDTYEDWRETPSKRAQDLAQQISIEQIAGLMLYSPHMVVNDSVPNEKIISCLLQDQMRHILVTKVKNAYTAALWHNNLQAIAEAQPFGIPTNNSSDPRNYTEADGEFNAGSGGDISQWPREIGLAATFDMDIIHRHAHIASIEYRALGITTTLSPQIDLSTDPRWRRFYGTFSEDADLCTDIARVYTDAFQTTPGSPSGWGNQSVNCMAKHWPGGGTGEGGRDAHYCFGQYGVYPGNNFEEHLLPFTQGALQLDGPTSSAAAIMPYYTISYGINPSGENVANGYSRYIITDLLREKYGFDGVVCTDWIITADNPNVEMMNGKPWGVEHLSVEERHFQAIYAGCDQFGGNDDKQPILAAYQLWCQRFGKESAEQRFRASAQRLLLNFFRVGVFENPYVDPNYTAQVVGCKEFVEEGYDAQLKSIVMLKNHQQVMPIKKGAKVYFPKRYYPASIGFFSRHQPNIAHYDWQIDTALIKQYYQLTDNPDEADFALLYIFSPEGNWGYSEKDVQQGGTGYVPISLQYEDYTATNARVHSIAGGDIKESFTNRTYHGKSDSSYNRYDMLQVIQTKQMMGDKPVIVLVQPARPFIPAEIEPYSDGLLLGFGVKDQAYLDILCGDAEPYGLLPMQLPKDMHTVETQLEDVAHDMECYTDADGHIYDFAFGLNWNGIIHDARVKKYAKH
jgi:beta-glucosidase